MFDTLDQGGEGEIPLSSITQMIYDEMEQMRSLKEKGGIKYALRSSDRSKQAPRKRILVDVESSLTDELRSFMIENAARVVDVFKRIDQDGNGSISRSEFHEGMPILGLEVGGDRGGGALTIHLLLAIWASQD